MQCLVSVSSVDQMGGVWKTLILIQMPDMACYFSLFESLVACAFMLTIIFSALSPDCYFEPTSVPTEGSMTHPLTAEFAMRLTATLSLVFPPIWQQK